MKKYKCYCNFCGKEIWVKFMFSPTEEDKLGFCCDECYDERNKDECNK